MSNVEQKINIAQGVAVGIAAGLIAKRLVTSASLFFVGPAGWLAFAVVLGVVIGMYRKIQQLEKKENQEPDDKTEEK